jgi:hypothetical protein
MVYDVGVWISGLILLIPVVVLGTAWATRRGFSRNSATKHWQEILYLTALVAASASTLAYLGYWGWRLCQLYEITLPFMVLLTLEWSIRVCRMLSATAIVGFLIGRGPYRIPLALAMLWVLLQLWRGGIIHWA